MSDGLLRGHEARRYERRGESREAPIAGSTPAVALTSTLWIRPQRWNKHGRRLLAGRWWREWTRDPGSVKLVVYRVTRQGKLSSAQEDGK